MRWSRLPREGHAISPITLLNVDDVQVWINLKLKSVGQASTRVPVPYGESTFESSSFLRSGRVDNPDWMRDCERIG
jgi:hypothetical protein